jgi:hypothetical protein
MPNTIGKSLAQDTLSNTETVLYTCPRFQVAKLTNVICSNEGSSKSTVILRKRKVTINNAGAAVTTNSRVAYAPLDVGDILYFEYPLILEDGEAITGYAYGGTVTYVLAGQIEDQGKKQ